MEQRLKLDPKDPIYGHESAARAHLEKLRWPKGPVCPRCGAGGERVTRLVGRSTRPGVYKCNDCRKPFTVTIGTVMERSHVPLSMWARAAYLLALRKDGLSARDLQDWIRTNYETAWFLFRLLKEAETQVDAVSSKGPIGPSRSGDRPIAMGTRERVGPQASLPPDVVAGRDALLREFLRSPPQPRSERRRARRKPS